MITTMPIYTSAYFNPRTPLQSAIIIHPPILHNPHHFNPRTPLQSAMAIGVMQAVSKAVISIHALRYRVRLSFSSLLLVVIIISIHALRYRVRCCRSWSSNHSLTRFQSTHSVTECDKLSSSYTSTCVYFNPRTPLQSAIARYCGSSLKYSFSM